MSDLLTFVDHPWILGAAICLAIPVIWGYWRWFFGDAEDFATDLEDADYRDWINLLRGRYWEGEWAEVKIIWFVIISGGFVAALYAIGVRVFY